MDPVTGGTSIIAKNEPTKVAAKMKLDSSYLLEFYKKQEAEIGRIKKKKEAKEAASGLMYATIAEEDADKKKRKELREKKKKEAEKPKKPVGIIHDLNPKPRILDKEAAKKGQSKSQLRGG